ncbi:hypothetical protein C8J27_101598 [Rhodobacter aestuarii]|uniref:Uncharacterized protein n=1 Tax=Rhodobacter aestuarii TaxID=453582 RepID=A0A1N7IVM5_9RHOB|nr:hypothetical protein [Rhodobacter aestuarii]PTV97482.1 hypothetical protein C8J27_101598 [Rhodobacter aestuarii]SIS41142.1 hypothetical protein SAMN05421580_10144 [Rhodobacter aestuarii]
MRLPLMRLTVVSVSMAVTTGAVIVLGLTAGYHDWMLFAVAATFGFVVGGAFGLIFARWLREAQTPLRPESPSMDPEAARRAVRPQARVAYPPAPQQSIA